MSLDGKIPFVSFVVVIVLQTFTAIWWASALDKTVSNQGESIKELKVTVTALTSAKVVVLEAEVARLQAELVLARAREQRR